MSEPNPDSEMALDLSAYYERIGLHEPVRQPTLDSLERLHAAHLEAIPFENLDQRLGRPVGLDLESLQNKLIINRRGGYCFEQNTLFAAVLRTLGFSVSTLEARVRPPGAKSVLPRTHMVLAVEIDRRWWLADVGFGGDGIFLPVPLDGERSRQAGEEYEVVNEDGSVLVLRGTVEGEWRDLYAFRDEPVLPVDFEMAHYYTATHPKSRFRTALTVQRSTRTGRHALRGRTYTRTVTDPVTRTGLSDEEAHELITTAFRLDVPLEDVRAALELS
ncbi:MAG: arylamine N-acetyltransferase [Thermoanaerobaculia bacterium]|nr:arylamine N-acetyltransferase [Thermoanaerobaculia bacterium]